MIKHAIRRPSNFHHDPSHLLRSCKQPHPQPHLLLQLHAHLIISGLAQRGSTTTHLINSYSSIGNSHASRLIFNNSTNPSVVSWNSMIRAYTKTDHNREALELYNTMLLHKRLQVDKYTFTFALKACAGAMDLKAGVEVHAEIARRGLGADVFIGTGLVDMYCKMGEVGIAREVFDEMPVLDVVAWNAMIAGLARSLESSFEALELFRRMGLSGIEANSVTLLNLFPAVSRVSDSLLCKSVHGFVVRRDFPCAVSNGLIDMYSKCGNVDDARQVFDCMRGRDDISWGTMMAGYTHNGCFVEALELFDYLKGVNNLKLNQVSVVSALMAAAEIRDLEKGREIHSYIVQWGGTNLDVMVATPLMTLYAKCGELGKAKEIFDGVADRDVVVWSALIAAFVQAGHCKEGLSLFREMQNGNVKPNRITLISILPACADLCALRVGKSIHCYIIRLNIGLDASIGTALVAMYAKCGSFSLAHILFDMMGVDKDVVAWNALINGYAQIGDANNAMEMYCRLRLAGVFPDSGTMVGVLPACVLMNALDEGTGIHGQIIKSGFAADLHVRNALIDMYAKCGDLITAEFLFNENELTRDVITWNVMITGYVQNGCANKAITTFHLMRLESIQPNVVTVVSVLPAAAYLAAIKDGISIHAYVIRSGLESIVPVGNSLIDMYAKCGRLHVAEEFFRRMAVRDIVSWNAMLAGYALNGLGHQAVEFFSQMVRSSEVDSVTFINVLSACRHGGLVEDGRNIFHSMRSKHQIEPQLEHYACMVDLLGRAGKLEDAWDFIHQMPMQPDAGVWGAFLGACRMHSNSEMGEIALDNLIKLEPQNPAHHIVLSNIYAQTGRWGDVGKLRTKMSNMGLKKVPGCSWVEIKNEVHAFKAGDQTHPQFGKMSILWDDLLEKMEKMGYVPDTSCVLHDVEEEEKESFLYSHSERLALVFALLNTEPGVPIQIVKNLRVCPDCHTAMKFISEITARRIIARDANRFHHFENGTCSCKDYW
ncbi:hypothetical protein Sjap_018262 [Stephania japonica]|uniref:DYW domain-containing protein n=1 Tax=Stephania japonica TaxID=461633 RepID=A0AAP0I7R5_9MAGN